MLAVFETMSLKGYTIKRVWTPPPTRNELRGRRLGFGPVRIDGPRGPKKGL